MTTLESIKDEINATANDNCKYYIYIGLIELSTVKYNVEIMKNDEVFARLDETYTIDELKIFAESNNVSFADNDFNASKGLV